MRCNAASWRRLSLAWLVSVACLLGLSACTTTGSNFDSSALPLLVPGHTTLAQASALFHSDPVDVYRQRDGSATARWAHKATLSTDAIYFNRELWLAFGPDGRYQRVVKSVNIPSVHEFPAQQSMPIQ